MLLFSFPAAFSCFECSISQMCYFLKNQGEQRKQPSNQITPPPPAPAKKQDALCTSQPLISPQNSTRRLGKLSCLVSFFALHVANIHASLSLSTSFLCHFTLWQVCFKFYFYYICLVSVCPSKSWWVIDSFWKRRD